jgi:alkylation response protein AidB-like acyl-CoA dehydrogenase
MSGLIADTDEHRLIRQSAATIAARYGHAYYAERAKSGGNIDELWDELGQAGLLGVHLPAEYGGGGAGLAELVVVTEELAAHGLPLLIAVISPAICGSILAAHASPDMKAAGCLAWRTGRGRWRSRSPSRTPGRTATTSARPRAGRTRAGRSAAASTTSPR